MKNAKTPSRNLAVHEVESAVEAVLYETVRLFHRLRVVMEELHHQGELSSGKSGILKSLDRHGPQTVPQMARARPVSRQYIQTLVNPLLKENLVELLENPAHKKSSLVALTERGEKLVRRMRKRERDALERLEVNLDADDLRSAREALEALREIYNSGFKAFLLPTDLFSRVSSPSDLYKEYYGDLLNIKNMAKKYKSIFDTYEEIAFDGEKNLSKNIDKIHYEENQ